jgi:Mn-dependent DtxR family transcriptional regulator
MNSSTLDAMVLRAMLRLARRRQAADDGEIAVRVGAAPHAVRASLRRLDALDLVERLSTGSRLTMMGLALAVAALPGSSRPSRRPQRASRAA